MHRGEMKVMVSDAVEEVSARHENATAHLVTSLAAMVGQWSTDHLLDGVDALLRERLEAWEERLPAGRPSYLDSPNNANSSSNSIITNEAALTALIDKVDGLGRAIVIQNSSNSSGDNDINSSVNVEKLVGLVSAALVAELARYAAVPGTLRAMIDPAVVADWIRNSDSGKSSSSSAVIAAALDETAPVISDKLEASPKRALAAALSESRQEIGAAAATAGSLTAAQQRRVDARHAFHRRHALFLRRCGDTTTASNSAVGSPPVVW